jgi:nucleoside-diphosphate-sugar epimerase
MGTQLTSETGERRRNVRYLITGGSGYIGSRLVESLAACEEAELVVNLDLHPPARAPQKSIFVKGDVRDHTELQKILERDGIDCLIHLAFIVNPLHDEKLMYDIDVNGTKAVLRAVSEKAKGSGLQDGKFRNPSFLQITTPQTPKALNHLVGGFSEK